MNAKKIIAAILAVVTGAGIPAFADVAALTATISGNDVSVTVPAGVLDDTSALYLVWDDVDHGEKLADWPTANRIAYSGSPAVSSSAATYTLSKAGVPSGAYMRIIATSDVRLIDGYVKLGAYQYVNTGVSATRAYGLNIKYRYVGTYTGGNYASLIGGVLDADFTIGRYVYNNADSFYFTWHGAGNQTALSGLATSTDVHEITVADRVASLDGVPKISNLAEGAMGTIDRPVILGATWKNTSPYTELSGRYLHAEWYYATLYDSEHEALVNLVPALRGGTTSPEAVFYDTVSGECFANAGTGTLDYSGDETNRVAVLTGASSVFYNGKMTSWTGIGNGVSDTASWDWSCGTGSTESGLPDSDTVISISGNVAFDAASYVPHKALIVDATLTGDCDWTGFDPSAATVTEVEYLDAPPFSYIDTGFRPDSNTRVVMDVTVQSASEYWFGMYTNKYNSGAFAVGNDGKGVYVGFGNSAPNFTPQLDNGRHTIDFDKGVVKVDGTQKASVAQTFDKLGYNIYLFLQNRIGTPTPRSSGSTIYQGTIRMHSCQIYDNGDLVRDYVPARRGTVFGLYEKKSGTFVENADTSHGTAFAGGAETGTVLSGGTASSVNIDLAGRKLSVSDCIRYMTGTITDSVGGGELHVKVDEGKTVNNENVALTGSLKLVKEGAGMLVGAKAGQTYTGGTLVSGGRAKCAVADRPWGAALSLVTISDGATFDWAGAFTQTGSAYNFAVAGSGTDGNGALVSTGLQNTWNVSTIANLELLGDALIGGYGGWGFSNVNGSYVAHTLTMNGHTLSISLKGSGTDDIGNNTGMFAFRSVTTSGTGTISFVNAMSSRVFPSFFGLASDLSSVTLDLGVGYSINAEVAPTIGTFIDRRSVEGTQIRPTYAITVLDCFKPMAANLVRTVALGDATHLSPVLDLSAINEPFVVPSAKYSMSMASGAIIKLKFGDRKVTSSTPIITWTGEKPSWVDNLRFSRGDSGLQYGITVKDDGIYAVSGLTITFY